jgi:CheY-like chemotaxis protein
MTNSESEDDAFKALLSELRHDLRTPIGHVIGYAEMIAEELSEADIKSFAHDLEAIQNAGQKMLALIDQYFSVAKKSAGEIDFGDAQFQMRMQLNHISGYAEMLREDALDAGNDDILGDLDHISAAQIKVLELVEAIGQHFLENKKQKSTGKRKAPAAPEAPKPTSFASIYGVGGEILVVDDNPGNRELLARRLARSGYTSVCVDSGEAALEALAERRYDLVLLDQIMPGKTGLEVLQIMQSSLRLRTIPVIMLSAADDSELMVQCILSGAEDYVAKPFNPVLLTARINACLEKVRLRQNIARQLRVFISSPGDVIPERLICKAIIGRLNEEFSGKAYLIPILWEEEPLLASDTFQAQIHPPRETDIYVGILWSRIGSPLPETIKRADGSIYDSGTAFEFEDALAGHRETGSPQMLLYRKTGAPSISLEDRGNVMERLDQIDRLHNYTERFLMGEDGSYVAAFHNFQDGTQFETMIEMHMRKLVERVLLGDIESG